MKARVLSLDLPRLELRHQLDNHHHLASVEGCPVQKSTRVAELSRGTVHVDGSEVIVDSESTVSFEVSLNGPGRCV